MPPKRRAKAGVKTAVSRGTGIKGLNWNIRYGTEKPIAGASLGELERRLAAL